MQAYYEIEIDIPKNHRLNLVLPDDIPEGKAKVAIIYELPNLQTKNSEDLIKFRAKQALSNKEIKELILRYPVENT
ncbi:MAG: hypothetical protein WCP96_16675 [Methylococcaceae bacterium]